MRNYYTFGSGLRERERAKIRKAAAEAVAKAVKRGELPPAKTQKCVDCGKQASEYDHRDYTKYLDVQPVCRGCNCRRGAGRPYDGVCKRSLRLMLATEKRLKITLDSDV